MNFRYRLQIEGQNMPLNKINFFMCCYTPACQEKLTLLVSENLIIFMREGWASAGNKEGQRRGLLLCYEVPGLPSARNR
jgi:hypothetical protein